MFEKSRRAYSASVIGHSPLSQGALIVSWRLPGGLAEQSARDIGAFHNAHMIDRLGITVAGSLFHIDADLFRSVPADARAYGLR